MSTQPFNEELPEELKALEVALRQLTPTLGRLNRDRLMYLAGRASAADLSSSFLERPPEVKPAARYFPQSYVSGRIWWQLATVVLLFVSITLGGLLVMGEHGTQRVVYVNRPQISSMPQNTATSDDTNPRTSSIEPHFNGLGFLELRNLVLANGLDALPTPQRNGNNHEVAPITWPTLWEELTTGKLGG